MIHKMDKRDGSDHCNSEVVHFLQMIQVWFSQETLLSYFEQLLSETCSESLDDVVFLGLAQSNLEHKGMTDTGLIELLLYTIKINQECTYYYIL